MQSVAQYIFMDCSLFSEICKCAIFQLGYILHCILCNSDMFELLKRTSNDAAILHDV